MAAYRILGSVGINGKNNAKDVRLVQALLNVYLRATKAAPLQITGKVDSALETSIKIFQKHHMQSKSQDGQIVPGGRAFEQLKTYLNGIFKPLAISSQEFGLLTWESEGADGGRYHSRKLHVPSVASELTIGRGYDMKTKSAATIATDLAMVGVDAKKANVLKLAAGISGGVASQFIIDNDLLDFQITPEEQRKLFKISYDAESSKVKRICDKKDVVLTYGKTDWLTLNTIIKDIAIDLKFRGDYTGEARKNIQKSIANNDLTAFKLKIKEKSLWPNVPRDRHERRSRFVDTSR